MTSVRTMERSEQEQHQRKKPWSGFGFSHRLHIEMIENFNNNDNLNSQGNNNAIVFNYYDVSVIDREFYLKMLVFLISIFVCIDRYLLIIINVIKMNFEMK